MMQRQSSRQLAAASPSSTYDDEDTCFTYRPLSNLPTPPPSFREASSEAQSPVTTLDDGEDLNPRYRGPAIHLVNLVPAGASLSVPSVSLVQAILSRANLPIETVALAVGILDSLDSKFARKWRLSCPLHTIDLLPLSVSSINKRHTLPPNLILGDRTPGHDHHHRQLHIDSVGPEVIILAALVIAVKFTEDPQQHTEEYCRHWGHNVWSHQQLNVTERCIMESLEYRILPLCAEDCLADAMVDMQLAARQDHFDLYPQHLPSPTQLNTPRLSPSSQVEPGEFVLAHSRSKTMSSGKATLGLGLSITPLETPVAVTPRVPAAPACDYFKSQT